MQSDINMKIFKIFYKEHYYQRDCREAFYETLRPKKNLETMGSRGENYACNQFQRFIETARSYSIFFGLLTNLLPTANLSINFQLPTDPPNNNHRPTYRILFQKLEN